MAKKQTLTGVLHEGIKRLPKGQMPPKRILFDWYGKAEQVRERNAKLNAAAVKAVQEFAAAGFRSVVLKGQGIARLYPVPTVRVSGDIDLWVEGSREEIISFIRKLAPTAPATYQHISLSIPGGFVIEAHFHPCETALGNKVLSKFFEEQSSACFSNFTEIPFGTADNGKIPVPTLAFDRIYILLHIFQHLLGEGIGLRQLQDYYYVLRQGFTEEERNETLYLLDQLHLRRFLRGVLWILQEVFGLELAYMLDEPEEKFGRLMLREILRAGNFGKYDTRYIPSHRPGHLLSFWRWVCGMARNYEKYVRFLPSWVLLRPFFRLKQYISERRG